MEPASSAMPATLPPLVLGCATFGGVGSLHDLIGQGVSREVAFELMDTAWARGIHWFDTADAYAGGQSEAWIGDWIQATGNRPRVSTKTFNPMTTAGDAGLSRERVLRQAESSLNRLRVERIDLYLAHEFDPSTPIEETFTAFEDLVDRGTIAAYGVSNFSAEQLELALGGGRPAVVQNSYSALNRRDERDVIPLAARGGVAYQAYSPLAGGWLSGKYRSGEPMPPGSRLLLVPQWYEHIDAAHAFRVLAQVEEVAATRGTSVAALAQAWASSRPGIDSVVVGPRRPEHLAAVFEAREIASDPGVIARLAAIFAESSRERSAQ